MSTSIEEGTTLRVVQTWNVHPRVLVMRKQGSCASCKSRKVKCDASHHGMTWQELANHHGIFWDSGCEEPEPQPVPKSVPKPVKTKLPGPRTKSVQKKLPTPKEPIPAKWAFPAPTSPQSDEELLNSLVLAATNLPSSNSKKSFLAYMTHLVPKDSDHWEMVTAFPLGLAPNLGDVLRFSSPPPIDFFKSLPTLPVNELLWGVYVLVFEKAGQEPRLYVGSGTDSKSGVRGRFSGYDRGGLPALPVKAVEEGWTESHRGLLCWSPIPSEYERPLQRLRFVAMEATLAYIFAAVVERPHKKNDVWSEIVLWPEATFGWGPLCTHTAFWEVPTGTYKIGVASTESELAEIALRPPSTAIKRELGENAVEEVTQPPSTATTSSSGQRRDTSTRGDLSQDGPPKKKRKSAAATRGLEKEVDRQKRTKAAVIYGEMIVKF